MAALLWRSPTSGPYVDLSVMALACLLVSGADWGLSYCRFGLVVVGELLELGEVVIDRIGHSVAGMVAEMGRVGVIMVLVVVRVMVGVVGRG
jgi:hypothetical protein